jgi:hypothetical protein
MNRPVDRAESDLPVDDGAPDSPDVAGQLLTRADDLYADEERKRRIRMTERSIARAEASPA